MRNQSDNTPAGDVDMPTEIAGQATDEAIEPDLLRTDNQDEATSGPPLGPALEGETGTDMTEEDFDVPGAAFQIDDGTGHASAEAEPVDDAQQ